MNYRNLVLRIAVLVFIFGFSALSLCYAQFTGGDGSEANPYQVSSVAQLNSVRNYPGSHFVQTVDLDLNVEP